jgi:Spy/CpxP family protein refolding chaperone
MKRMGWILTAVVALTGGVMPAGAEAPRPVFHEEAGQLVEALAQHLSGLRAQMEQHMPRRPGEGGPPGGMMTPGHGMMTPGGGMMGRGMDMGSPGERPLITVMLHHRAELGLSAEQVQRLETLRSDFAREAIRRDADIRIAELDLAGLLGQEPVDLVRVEAKVREAAQIRAELRLARLRTIEQGKAVLTAEQRTRLQGLLAGMHGPGHRSGAPRSAGSGALRM